MTRKEHEELASEVAHLKQKLYALQEETEKEPLHGYFGKQRVPVQSYPGQRVQDAFDRVSPDPAMLTMKVSTRTIERGGFLASFWVPMAFGLKRLWPAIAGGALLGLTSIAALAAVVFSVSELWGATIASLFAAACAFSFFLALIGASR